MVHDFVDSPRLYFIDMPIFDGVKSRRSTSLHYHDLRFVDFEVNMGDYSVNLHPESCRGITDLSQIVLPNNPFYESGYSLVVKGKDHSLNFIFDGYYLPDGQFSLTKTIVPGAESEIKWYMESIYRKSKLYSDYKRN